MELVFSTVYAQERGTNKKYGSMQNPANQSANLAVDTLLHVNVSGCTAEISREISCRRGSAACTRH